VRYFTVKNFERFQHYKAEEGAPRWIKLYRELLTDYDFLVLADDAKAHLMLIWLLASQARKALPCDPKWIATRIGATGKVDLEQLISAGFLVLEPISESGLEPNGKSPSILISSDLVSSPLSEEGESEGKPAEPEPLKPQDLADAWNEHCLPSGFSRVTEITPKRHKQCALRLREHPKLEFWEGLFGQIRGSPYLLSRPTWFSFDWLIENDTNPVKVFEGKYRNEQSKSQRAG
jgi:hypothetical protein